MIKKNLDKPQKIRTSLEELEVLSRLSDTTEWAIAKRVANRYISNLRRISFGLSERDPHLLSIRHAGLIGQAIGIRDLIRIVDKAGKQLDKDGGNT